MSTKPMEPMDTYLCVLLQLQLIVSPGHYTQPEICGIIVNNQSSFDAIYNSSTARQQARNTYIGAVAYIDITDKEADCG